MAAGKGSEDLRALLVTHNVCGVFDHMESALPFWVQELQALVREQSADFVALHMQEVGGSEWKKGNLRLDTFTQAFQAGFPDFWCSGLLCSNCTETPECFSALGCLYLVRRTAIDRVQLWHFGGPEAEEPAGWRGIDPLPSPLQAGAPLPAAFVRHERFPQTFFPEFPTWSRKGFLHTRWQLGAAACDLVNVHFFHDQSNLGSLQRGEAKPLLSPYALSRQKALCHSMRQLLAEAQGAEALGGALPAAFVFGDFNFRLDLSQVVTHLCGAQGLAQALEQNVADDGPLHIPLSAPPDATAPKAAPKATSKAKVAAVAPAAPAPPGGSSASLLLAPKKCVLADYGALLRDHGVWRGFDVELDEYCRVAERPLLELPVDFPPTYPRREEDPGFSGAGEEGGAMAQGGPAAAAAFGYEGKRCPSWCDRIVMSTEGLDLVHSSRGEPAYGSQIWRPSFTDHNKVYLAFSCA